jgi:hypothetical protein
MVMVETNAAKNKVVKAVMADGVITVAAAEEMAAAGSQVLFHHHLLHQIILAMEDTIQIPTQVMAVDIKNSEWCKFNAGSSMKIFRSSCWQELMDVTMDTQFNL